VTRYLNFGAGPNQLPAPWQNLNAEHDIRKRLKFEDASVRGILAEHVIEHVPFLQGYNFVGECLRVLEPGGVLRLAFPDIGRFVASSATDLQSGACLKDFNGLSGKYAEALAQRPDGALLGKVRRYERIRGAMTLLLAGWHHQCAWTEASAAGVLLTAGFHTVTRVAYGRSAHADFEGVDGHHRDVGLELAELETTVMEAIK